MPRFSVIQTNFTAGELTPKLKGRVDVARYQNGVEVMENAIPSIHGGASRRYGTRYLATQKYASTRKVRLIPYVFNEDQAYLVEMGHLHARFYTADGALILDAGLNPLEVVTPYTESHLPDLRWRQKGDTLFLFHNGVKQQQLQRITADVWTFGPVRWTTEPFDELGHLPNGVLTVSNPAPGTGRTFTTADTTVPAAPTIGTAYPLDAAASVNFTPNGDGGIPITGFTATSTPGSITGTGTASPVRVNGLTNGVAYTFKVHATNVNGDSAQSAASNSVTPDPTHGTGTLSPTAAPLNYTHFSPNGIVALSGPVASCAGATPPLAFAWTKLSGTSAIQITDADAAQVKFTSNGTGTTNVANFRCTVTDALGATGHVDVSITVTHHFGREPEEF